MKWKIFIFVVTLAALLFWWKYPTPRPLFTQDFPKTTLARNESLPVPRLEPQKPRHTEAITEVKNNGESIEDSFRLTADQDASLSESKAQQEEWEAIQDRFFRSESQLSSEQLDKIAALRQQAREKEDALIHKPVESETENLKVREELLQNRQNFERVLRSELGPEKFEALKQLGVPIYF